MGSFYFNIEMFSNVCYNNYKGVIQMINKKYLRSRRTHPVAFRVPEPVWEYLKGIAEKEGCTVSSVMNAIIEAEMDREESEAHE